MIDPAVLDAMVASGCTAEQISAAVKAACRAEEEAAEVRREKDRIRKKLARDLEKTPELVRVVPVESASVHGNPRTSMESADGAGHGSLSPVPLLPPIPPNNPLTPKPSTKTNSRGTRLPADWTMGGPDLAYALSKNLSEREAIELFERFCSWAWSAGGTNAVKVNWHQAWQGWVQRDGPKIIAARVGPLGKPLTEHQRKQREAKEISDGLENFAARSGLGNQANLGLIRHDPGSESASLRGGFGGDVVDISSPGNRARG